jgi:hypothetical protein
LTETDLLDLEDNYDEQEKKKADTNWDNLLQQIGRKNVVEFEAKGDPGAYLEVVDMDDITAEVNIFDLFSIL